MTKLVIGHDAAIAKWVKDHIPDVTDFGPCVAIGMASPCGRLLWGGVVFSQYDEHTKVCQVAIASVNPRWATRGTIRAILSIPFEQYECRKVYAMIATDNKESLKLCGGLRFKPEATLRHHFAKGRHAVMYSMMDNEYRKTWARLDFRLTHKPSTDCAGSMSHG